MSANDRPELDRDERAFVDRLNEAFEPPEFSAQRRVAFNAKLEERIERSRRGSWRPFVAGAAVAAAAAWLAFVGAGDSVVQSPAPQIAQSPPTAPPRRLRPGKTSPK